MSNLSQIKRQRMIEFLERLKEEHKDDDVALIALGEIESELNAKKYGLVWEDHEEAVDVKMQTHIPVFTEETDKEISTDENDIYNFILEGDNLHSLRLLEKTHQGKIDVIYIDPPYNTGNKDFRYDDTPTAFPCILYYRDNCIKLLLTLPLSLPAPFQAVAVYRYSVPLSGADFEGLSVSVHRSVPLYFLIH